MKIRGGSFVVCLGLLCLGLLSVSAAHGQQYTIQTLAGNGVAGFAGDGGSAASAQLSSPNGVALDSKGNLYIADTGNQRIRMIAVSGGNITTIAGTGTAGYSGDKTAATAALLSSPSGLAFDSKDQLYIADTGNDVIRMISGTTITTVAGLQGQTQVFGGDLGPATLANLFGPTAIAFDAAGNYYIADNRNNLIRKVDISTGIITTVVGASGGTNGTSGKLTSPNGLWIDAAGALYIADSGNQRVAKFVPPSALGNFAGNFTAGFSGDGGLAIRAQLNNPKSIKIDAAGNTYVADTNNSRIRKITNGIITTIAGRGGAGYNLGDDGGSATAALLSFPRSIAIGSNGTIYIADTGNHVIRTLTPTPTALPTITAKGVGNAASYATVISPGALAVVFGTGFGNSTYVADGGHPWVTSTADGVSVQVNGVAAPLYYVSPGQINFQVPWATPTTGTVNVAVLVNGGSSNIAPVAVGTAAPGLFVRLGQAAVVNSDPKSDGSINDPSHPAKAGTTISAYLTGSGPVSPAAADGVPASTTTLTHLQASATATIDNLPANVSFAGLAPTFIGLVQMNIDLPAGLAPGTYPLSVTIDGQTSNAAPITVN